MLPSRSRPATISNAPVINASIAARAAARAGSPMASGTSTDPASSAIVVSGPTMTQRLDVKSA